jgi:hypothetical protein
MWQCKKKKWTSVQSKVKKEKEKKRRKDSTCFLAIILKFKRERNFQGA